MLSVTAWPRFRAASAFNFPRRVAELSHGDGAWGLRVLKSSITRCRFSPPEGTWLQDISLPERLRHAAAGLMVALILAVLSAAPAVLFALRRPSFSAAPAMAAPPPAATWNSTDSILKWINAYRHRPAPDDLPAVVRALSGMQAFKDAESSGPYIGFIAGVLGDNPDRAETLIAKMLSIDPADHWVLVRAIAYSGLPDWKELLATFVDRMADAPRDDRPISRRQTADARADRLSEREAWHARQDQSVAAYRQGAQEAGRARADAGTDRRACGAIIWRPAAMRRSSK